jgi:hypothetical protein
MASWGTPTQLPTIVTHAPQVEVPPENTILHQPTQQPPTIQPN